MKWFYDMKIGTRLLMAFIIVGAITALIGYLGITSMSKIADLSRAAYEHQTLGIAYLKQADISLIHVDRDVKNLLLAGTAEDLEHYKSRMEVDIAAFNENLEKARPLIRTGQGIEMLEKDDQTWKEYLETARKIVDLAMQDGHEKNRASVQLSDGIGNQKVNAVEEALARSESFKEGRARQFEEEGIATFQSSRTLLLVLVVAGVFAGLGFGVFISRSISRPLGIIAEIARNISLGDVESNS